jgi:hypothetical protein
VLPVHEEEEEDDDEAEEAELAVVLDDCPCVEDVSSLLPSSSRFWPISARVSVKFSISSRSGTFALTESTRFLTTSSAQLISFATSLTAPLITLPMLDIILLLRSIVLSCLSDSAPEPLFLFVFEQSGSSGGLTFKSSSKASVSCCVFLTASRY